MQKLDKLLHPLKSKKWKEIFSPANWLKTAQAKVEEYKDRKKRKELRRRLRRNLKNVFSFKTFQKIVIGLVSVALIASYILPYIIS
jgi:uncharacterized membrane protein YheB (UPF0754 family)